MYLFSCTIVLLGLLYTIFTLFVLTISIRSYNKYERINGRKKVKTQYNIDVGDFFLLEKGNSRRYRYNTYFLALGQLTFVFIGLFTILGGVESVYYSKQTLLEGLIQVLIALPFLSLAIIIIYLVKTKIKSAGGFKIWIKKYQTLMKIEEN